MPREKVGEEKHARRGTMYMEPQALYSLEEQVKKTLYNLRHGRSKRSKAGPCPRSSSLDR